ncbi:MAG: hypothetical protein FNT29_03370 [Halothiobacillaceae bacterium]|nr:MAG: hypothetical protein FNT29_03370 [Halothiobacillaceae bacterium]
MSQRLSVDEFVAKVRSLSVVEIGKLPLETLPETIPSDLIRNSPQPLRGVLEKLAFDVNVHELREQQGIEKTFGNTAAQAMDKARGYEADIAIARLRQKMADIAPSIEKWRAGKVTHYAMAQTMQTVRELVHDLHAERARLARAELVLHDCLANPDRFSARLQDAMERIRHFAGKIDLTLGEYHALQLEVTAAEMTDKRRQIQESDQKKKGLLEDLTALEEQLKRPTSLFSRLVPWTARKHEEGLKHNISDMHQRILSEEWVMAETQLTRWLDSMVDASLYMSAGTTQQHLRSARLNLFYLLNAFCEQQEAAAKQIARNPFIQVDPKKAIEYMLMSERFILDYFAKKRAEIIEWLGNAADTRLRSLENLEIDLITEMKRNIR